MAVSGLERILCIVWASSGTGNRLAAGFPQTRLIGEDMVRVRRGWGAINGISGGSEYSSSRAQQLVHWVPSRNL